MKKFLLTFAALLIVGFSFAQIKVKQNGNVMVGSEIPTQDPDGVIKLHVLGTGAVGGGGKIAIGDYGRASTGSCNVLIGEYGSTDSDKLWLHGKYGIYLTYNNGSKIIGSYDVSNGNKFHFNCEVWSSGVKLTSDERLKTNIAKIDGSMTKLRKIEGVSYNLLNKDGLELTVRTDNNLSESIQLTDKEKQSKVFFENYEKNIKNESPKRMGFLAQDLQKVFPELVDKDSSGYYSVDYIGLIPVIIEALKEQDLIIETQNTKIEELQSLLDLQKDRDTNSSMDLKSLASLEQNFPNPFNQQTTIKYYLSNSVKDAYIYIFNMNGLQIKSLLLSQRGNGEEVIKSSELQAGMYIYTLVADGREIDTKRMILTQ